MNFRAVIFLAFIQISHAELGKTKDGFVGFTNAPITTSEVPSSLIGEQVKAVWRLLGWQNKQTFDALKDRAECFVEFDRGTSTALRIRFHFQETSIRKESTILKYLSLYASVLDLGHMAQLSFTVSIDELNEDLSVKSNKLQDTTLYITTDKVGVPVLISRQFLLFQIIKVDSLDRETTGEYLSTSVGSPTFGISVSRLQFPEDTPRALKHEVSPASSNDNTYISLAAAVYAMYNAEENHSDLQFKTKDNVFVNTHKFIVAARSPFLRKLLQNEISRKGFNGTINLSEINEVPLRAILYWMYSNELDPFADTVMDEVMGAAKLLELEELLQTLNEKLITICTPHNMMKLFSAAKEHHLSTAMEDIGQYIKLNIDSVSVQNKGKTQQRI